eukprot:CAMPEP_0182464002 /NCGR_PEP_ID=MMETSP1319-20130603/8170_1 /TAXON_ID=172717 /ORGANISM="Bolidomonas pacifica, Strain RCC208" /LENGTH=62 /DNA_ID=CAMNT_0024663603 /DNA_START=120 /DNA_END=308 /DNA_ORIENTATION=-
MAAWQARSDEEGSNEAFQGLLLGPDRAGPVGDGPQHRVQVVEEEQEAGDVDGDQEQQDAQDY